MPLKPNQVVTIHYTVKDENENIIDSTEKSQPFSFLSGQNQILPKLEDKISEMVIGSKKTVDLHAEEAYGEYKDEAVQKVDRSNFPDDTELKEGMSFVARTPDNQQVPFIIKDIQGEEITIDFNHPLAGKNLKFEVELLDMREATADEMAHGHVHGPGGHQH